MKPRLAVIISHPIQHFAPVYRHIAERGQIEICVFYLTDAGTRCYRDSEFNAEFSWDIDLLSGYRYEVLRPATRLASRGVLHTDAPELTPHLNVFRPHAMLLYGYSQSIQWRARAWATHHGASILYISDSSYAAFRGNWLKRIAKEIVVRSFLAPVDIFLITGDQNADYLKHYGADTRRSRRCPLSVDLNRFQMHLGDREAFAAESRAKLGIPVGRFTVLFSGKLVARKRPVDLVRAVAELHKQGIQITAVFAGSGPLADDLVREANHLGVAEYCVFLGFLNQSAIMSLQYAVDALVVPSSYDPHPLVVTEAAACGLPIIASDAIGCIGSTDTVQQEVNALVYPCGSTVALAKAILTLSDGRSLCEQMGIASLAIAETQSVAAAANAIEAATLELCSSKAPASHPVGLCG
ncbi:MAG: glycosyltransferase family 4 protein [Anaerolineae bacterium]